jgi:hypothetical protein
MRSSTIYWYLSSSHIPPLAHARPRGGERAFRPMSLRLFKRCVCLCSSFQDWVLCSASFAG